MPTFAICRTEKIKAWSTLTKSVGHNLRTSADDRRHLSANAPEPLRVLTGSPDWVAHWRGEVGAMWLPKLKQGTQHTKAREFFLGMSPEWAEGKTPAEIDAWTEANIAWLNARFGKDRVRLAVLPLDEQTPHIAAYVVPLKADANRAGERRIDRGNGWTLSDGALRLGGSRDALVALQDEYAAAMTQFTLERGQRNSKAKHQTVAAWRKQMAAPLPAIAVPAPPEATLADRIDIGAYGKRVAKAAAQEVFRQFKPVHQQAKVVPKQRKQLAAQLAEISKLRHLIDAHRDQLDFFAKALALLLGFEPETSSQQGMEKTQNAIKAARRQLRGEAPAKASKPGHRSSAALPGSAPSPSSKPPRRPLF